MKQTLLIKLGIPLSFPCAAITAAVADAAATAATSGAGAGQSIGGAPARHHAGAAGATAREMRSRIDIMALESLDRLFLERPGAIGLFNASFGYAVIAVPVPAVGAGGVSGYGIAVDIPAAEPTYLEIAEAATGAAQHGAAAGRRVVFLFENEAAYRRFVARGEAPRRQPVQAVGTADADPRFVDGVAAFALMEQGFEVAVAAAATRFRPAADLNR